MPPLFQPVKTTQSVLETTPIVDGKAYFVQDSERLFFDYEQVRTEIRDIIVLDTEGARSNILAPLNKFYFVIETTTLWLYKNGEWVEVSGGGSASLNYQSFPAGTAIASVTLDEAIANAGGIVSVTVDNAALLRSAYSVGDDLQTITFIEPITCELGIDVVYSKGKNSGSAVATASVMSASIPEVTNLTTTKSRSTSSNVQKDLVLTVGSVNQLSLTGHTNISFGPWTEGQQGFITLYLTIPDSYTLTLPADVKWKDGLAPNLEVDGNYILEFRSIDGGATVYGSIAKYI